MRSVPPLQQFPEEVDTRHQAHQPEIVLLMTHSREHRRSIGSISSAQFGVILDEENRQWQQQEAETAKDNPDRLIGTPLCQDYQGHDRIAQVLDPAFHKYNRVVAPGHAGETIQEVEDDPRIVAQQSWPVDLSSGKDQNSR